MSTDFTRLLEKAIGSLVNDGKEPSIALIKSRLSAPVPMPLIISALQRWKKSGTVPKVEKVDAPKDADARIAELEQQVKTLTERLNALEQRLA
ncbi:DUF5320 domain-containing protein [Enterovibrio nigricans]|uniref:KfrA N-terminal DNA-binding domain-containing protein n=1 Tax=Enterovibrio nigricans DSM 22720 TaxID=1121868 RepID=A0A1T4UCJ4_9GAMM|nr:DUF5320 domain-containing protein [Enterovibrio nigricans]PKF51485.1 hypothetical protein AT251_03705 [Enterovibrio nigricans]SKA50181.1 hypothetical protein SAMN02745132_01337 [Enterovibrio nigricans DSM 22720]